MFKPQVGQKSDPPTHPGQAQGVDDIIGIDEEVAVGETGALDPFARQKKANERRRINRQRIGAGVIRIGQMKARATAAADGGAQERPDMPERVARRAVHLADAAIGVEDPTGDRLVAVALQRAGAGQKARHDAGFGPGVIIHQHAPVGVEPGGHLAQPLFEAACPADVVGERNHMQARVGDFVQKFRAAVVRGVVDHQNCVDILGQQAVDGAVQLGPAVVGDHQSHQPQPSAVVRSRREGLRGTGCTGRMGHIGRTAKAGIATPLPVFSTKARAVFSASRMVTSISR